MTAWSVLTAVDDWLHAHRRLVAIICATGFVLSCLSYARFIRLPELWALPASVGWVLPALRYGVWEVLVTPKLAARRQMIEETDR